MKENVLFSEVTTEFVQKFKDFLRNEAKAKSGRKLSENTHVILILTNLEQQLIKELTKENLPEVR
ncbi:MAG: phage integrase SAM-like domain-containing protein [Crocinitomicaceae bacterium]